MREKLAEPNSATQVAMITLDKPKTEKDLKLRLNSCVFPIRCMSTASAFTPVLMPSPSGLSRPSWGVWSSITSFLDIVARVQEKNERRRYKEGAVSTARGSTELSSEHERKKIGFFCNRAEADEVTVARAQDCRLPVPWAIAYKVRSQRGVCHAGERAQSAAELPSLIRQRSRCAQCGGDARGLNATAAESQADRPPMSSLSCLCYTRHEARASVTETCAALSLGSACGCQVDLEPRVGSC